MKKAFALLSILIVSHLISTNALAQTASQEDADRVFDFVEMLYPDLFSPPAETQQANVADSDWFLRVYGATGITLAVNVNGTGPFFAGDVWALGGALGTDPVFVETLAVLIAFIDSQEADDDGDGVINLNDLCADTPEGETANAQGCSASQLDDDGDGVSNALDLCPDTAAGASVNLEGCSEVQLDDDNDGINNALDQCPATAAGVPVNSDGCSAVQLGIVVTQADADKLFDFAEILSPDAFAPPASTQLLTEMGSDWFVRTYTDTGISIKVNINGVGEFFAGNVYLVGGTFGDEEVFVDTLANLIAAIDAAGPIDDDDDGVANDADQCPATPTGESVDANGCSETQLGDGDDDDDGVDNAADQCPATPGGETVDANGCSNTQLDDDNDGVDNAADQCPATPGGASVDANGCSDSQLDDDNDGVDNAADQCPATPGGQSVDADGCSDSQLDDDNDGVDNAADQCPATPGGESVDANGCSETQLGDDDDDNDGVDNAADQCPATPGGQSVDANGCSNTQLDDDNDGVDNATDQCPATPGGQSVDANGCSNTQLDDDNDGVDNATDQCPATPGGQSVDANGCSNTQLDDDNDGVDNAADQCPATPGGQSVDANGCSDSQLDDDIDGVDNAADQCPATPVGQSVDANGCSSTQLDDDNDGVDNATDQCPATPIGETADAQGCSESQQDDGEGVVRSNYVIDEGSGVCVPVTQPIVGSFGRYEIISSLPNGAQENFVFTEEILNVTPTRVDIRGTQNLAGLQETESETIQFFEVINGLRFEIEYDSTSTTTFLIGEPITEPPETTYVVYDPPLFSGPADFFCEGMVLFYPSVLETVTFTDSFGLVTVTAEPTLSLTTTVISVSEVVNVPAGSFTTIHISALDEDGVVDVWTDVATGMLVKIEAKDNLENVIATTQLIELNP